MTPIQFLISGILVILIMTLIVSWLFKRMDSRNLPDDLDLDFNEFELDKFHAFDEASKELWDHDMRLERWKRVILVILFLIFLAVVTAYLTMGG